MGVEVVNRLREFGDLPGKGILAGQAVDSALTDLFGGGGGVYNDLDIFRPCTDSHARSAAREKATSTAMRAKLSVLGPLRTYGAMQFVMDLVGSYGIASVSRKGMLNYVNCYKAPERFGTSLTATEVISGFDINCTRVAVDLETNVLSWDAHYEAFRRSRQLEIAMMHTPWHTFLRLLKKQRELPNVFLDVELAAQACAAVSHSRALFALRGGRYISWLFGEKHAQQADEYQRELAPYFQKEAVTFHRDSPRWYWKRGPAAQDQGPLAQQVELWRLNVRSGLPASLQSRVDRLGAGCLFFTYEVLKEARRQKSASAAGKLLALQVGRAGPEASQAPRYVVECCELFETAYVQGQALPTVGDKVEAFVRKHAGFKALLMGLSLAKQHETLQRVQEGCRAYAVRYPEYLSADALLGVLETQAVSADLASSQRMLQLLDRIRIQDSVPFDIAPLVLPSLPAWWANVTVRELLSPAELKEEGRQLGHCVGGYSHAVRLGHSRILSIRSGPKVSQWSTVELRKSKALHGGAPAGSDAFVVVQHYGKANTRPPGKNSAVLKLVLSQIPPDGKAERRAVLR